MTAAPGVSERESARRAPRLLFVVTEDWYFKSHRLPLGLAAQREGYEVHVATRVGYETRAIEACGITVHPVPFARAPARLISDLRAVIALRAVYRRIRPDVVHNVALKPIVLGAVAAAGFDPPCVVDAFAGLGFAYSSSRPLARALRPLLGCALRHALRRPGHRTVVQNLDDKLELERLGITPLGQAIVVSGVGVDLDRFEPPPAPAAGPVVVLLVARMLRDKGVVEFVHAASTLRHQGVAARFVLVGDADPANPASISSEQLRAWHMSGVVEWYGRRDDIADLLRSAHIACLPSYREGMPLALLEAAACGLPLVATDVPGCREVVRPGENGLLVPVRDSDALARALGELIADPELRKRYGAGSRARAERYSSARLAQEMLKLYRPEPPLAAKA